MSPQDFVYWLQGFAELNEAPPSKKQWQAIRDHLALVFDKRTPDYTLPALDKLYRFPTDWKWPYEVTCISSPRDTSQTIC